MSHIIDMEALHRGEATSFDLYITEGGLARDLTGLLVEWKLYEYDDDAHDELVARTTLNGGIVIDPDQNANRGKAILSVTGVNTDRKAGGYLFKLWVTDGEGAKVICYGILQIKP